MCCNSAISLSKAWNFFKKNFLVLSRQYTSGSLLTKLIKGVTGHFNTEAEATEVEDFFSQYPLEAAAR